MPTPKLDPAKREEILRLGRKGYTRSQISDIAGVATGTVSNVLNHVETKESDRINDLAGYHKEKFEELLERFNTWIGDTTAAPKPKAKPRARAKKNFVINDIHAPFHNERALARAINENQDADECWIVGDAFDLFSFSRYEKYHAPFSPCEEFQHGRVLIRTLAERFPVVRVMHGNHDERFIKWLVRDKSIPPAILEFFKLQDPNFLSPLAKVCAGFKNVEMMQPKELDYARFPFIHQIGDCVLSHAEKFSKIPNRAVGWVIDWLKSYAEPQNLVTPFRCVIQAHTHQAGKVWGNYGVVGIEAGCLAKVPDYAGDPKINGAQRPSVIGYTVVYQTDGVTDLNRTNFVQVEA